MSSFEFIKAFVDMAHALKLSVVADGVEIGEVLTFLPSALCDEAQGYFLAIENSVTGERLTCQARQPRQLVHAIKSVTLP